MKLKSLLLMTSIFLSIGVASAQGVDCQAECAIYDFNSPEFAQCMELCAEEEEIPIDRNIGLLAVVGLGLATYIYLPKKKQTA